MPSTAHSCLFLCSRFSNGYIVNASVHWSLCLHLNHWAEFHQTCYMTLSHGKCVREQHYFSVFPFSSPSVCHTISSKTNVQNLTKLAAWLPHMFFLCPQLQRRWRGILLLGCPSVRPSLRPSVRLSVRSSRFLMHSITLKPWMLLFWNFIYGFLMKK